MLADSAFGRVTGAVAEVGIEAVGPVAPVQMVHTGMAGSAADLEQCWFGYRTGWWTSRLVSSQFSRTG